jgi:hypothetical protein
MSPSATAPVLASLVMLASCSKPEPSEATPWPATTPAPAPVPAAPSVPKLVDLCVHAVHELVCVLRDDGRVSCARVEAEQFPPPLAGITQGVEISCGMHSVCVRERNGAVTCLDNAGELRRLESLGPARSLARDCAVDKDGKVQCWTEDWQISPSVIPSELGQDFQRALIWSEGGCVLQRDGELWCWNQLDSVVPQLQAKVGEAGDIEELKLLSKRACWRRAGAWQCSDGKPPNEGLECDHSLCTCSFTFGYCTPPKQGIAVDESMTVRDVVLRDRTCVADQRGRVWCQSWSTSVIHEIALPLTSETSARLEPLVKPPAPKPKCPAAEEVSSRVCEHLGAQSCGFGSESYWMCEPDGFAIIFAKSERSETEYLAYVDGTRVWLGPSVTMPVQTMRDDEPPTVIDLHVFEEDTPRYYEVQHELSASLVCDLVEGQPACSMPIVRDWKFEDREFDDDGEVTSSESIRYQAEVIVTSTNVKVKVVSGKANAGSKHRSAAGTQILESGNYPLKTLLDQRFVQLPE